MIELFTTVEDFENFKNGEVTYAYNTQESLDGSSQPIVKILLPFEAVEHLGLGEFRLLIKGMEY